jgi:hypothetical protein
MTPEELNRTMEFIVASQARLAAAQEQDRQDRLVFEEWSKERTEKLDRLMDRQGELLNRQGELLNRTTDLLHVQSQRMDRMDKIYQDALRQNETFQQQALRLLNMILDRLPKPERPN